MSETLCKINKKGSILRKTLLWQNPNPNDPMNGGTSVTLASEITSFDFIRIVWRIDEETVFDSSYKFKTFADWPIIKISNTIPKGNSSTTYESNICLTNVANSAASAYCTRRADLAKDMSQSYIPEDPNPSFPWKIITFSDNYLVNKTTKNNNLNVPLLIYGIKYKERDIENPWAPVEEDETI